MKYQTRDYYIKMQTLRMIVLTVLVSLAGIGHAAEDNTCGAAFKSCKSDNINQLDILYKSCVRKVPAIITADGEAALCDAVYSSCESETDYEDFLKSLKSGADQNWKTASADSLGFNTTLFGQAFKSAGDIARFKSLTVLHKGKLVKQRFYNPSADSLPQPIKGVTQSITSLLVGIAIDKGYLKSEDQAIGKFFPDRPGAAGITIKDLLTMKSGIRFSDGRDWQSWTDYFDWLREDNASDWILSGTRSKVSATPAVGRSWEYSTPSIDLLGAAIRKSSDMTLRQFADKFLFQPLGIKNYLWDHDSNGDYYAGTGLRMYPDDLARIGQLVLDNGEFRGEQIVSRQWIKKSVYDRFEIQNGYEYGYLWLSLKINGMSVPHAEGFGGQYIFIAPELDTVIVTTSNTILCSGPEQRLRAKKVLGVAKQILQSIDDGKKAKKI